MTNSAHMNDMKRRQMMKARISKCDTTGQNVDTVALT